MTTLDRHTMPTTTGAPRLALARFAEAVSNVFRAWRNRGEIGTLELLSDAQLADIGLTRHDLAAAARAPLGVDPTEKLGEAVRSRGTLEGAARSVC